MLANNKLFPTRPGKFLGSLKDGRSSYDVYVHESKIVLVTDKVEMSEPIIAIGNNKEAYLYTPYLEAYNAHMYDK